MSMKRTLLAVMLLATLPSWAGKIKVLSGDLSVVQNSDITATVIFDYSDLEIEGKPYMEHLESRGADFVRDWPSESEQSEEYFIRCWNKDNDEGLQVTRAKGKEYTMVFDVNEMHMGSGAASMLVGFGAGGAKLSGVMYIFQGTNSVPVLTVEIDGQTGRSGMTEIARRLDLYGELAEDLVKTLEKTKPSRVKPAEEEAPSAIVGLLSGGKSTAKASKPVAKKSAVSKAKSPEKPSAAKRKQAVKKNVKKTEVNQDKRVETLLAAKAHEIPHRRKPVLGNFDVVADQRRIGVYLDFSETEIMGRTEESFVRYMRSSANKRDLDPDFDTNWEEDIKPSLRDLFISEVNEQLKDEDISLRLTSDIETDIVLKLEIIELDDDANNKINYLFVDMSSGEVIAQISCESSGGRVGRYLGLLNQGFESAGDDFAELLIDQID